jgi:hypothetical protein
VVIARLVIQLVAVSFDYFAFADTRVARGIVAGMKVYRTKNDVGLFIASDEVVRLGRRKWLARLYWFDRPRSDPDPLECDRGLVMAAGWQKF